MKDKISVVTRWILYGLLLLGAVPGILFYFKIMSINAFLNWGYFMLFLGAVVIIFEPVYTIIINPKNLIKMLVSVVFLAIIVAVSYGLATNHMTPLQLETYKITVETSKLVGMGLIVSYITIGLSVLVILYSGIVKLFK